MSTLSASQIEQYRREGYVVPGAVFTPTETRQALEEFRRLSDLLPEGKGPSEMCQWHEHDSFLYKVCSHPRVLDFVENLLGPDFYLWGSHFFAKSPNDPTPVAWHQDAFYWPLEPREAVTAWLAFTESSIENGCMRVIPRSHRAGILKHKRTTVTQANALWLELQGGQFKVSEAVDIQLHAGEISLHDDHIVHGSEGNSSPDWRIGLAIRYSPAHVFCDLEHWPRFLTMPMRGTNRTNRNPVAVPPSSRLSRFIQTPPMSTSEARERLMAKRGLVTS